MVNASAGRSSLFSVALMAVLLASCKGGSISAVSGQGTTTNVPANFQVAGNGICGKIQIDFGDGTPPMEVANYDFANITPITHTYTGWGGRKTVKAGSLENCVGEATMIFTIGPNPFNLAFMQPTAQACTAVPNTGPLRKNTTVGITTNPDPNIRIGFGCVGGCTYDADGRNEAAPAGYPFPGLKPLSLVLRVGTQVVQGGTSMGFTTNQAGPLEVCVNDYKLDDNFGAWGVRITVDESAAQ